MIMLCYYFIFSASDIKDLRILKNEEEAQKMPEVRHGPASTPGQS